MSDDSDELFYDQVTDGDMLEFLPRNSEGFQDELLFRYKSNLPFVSGSLSAHECCAVAAHNARKVMVVEKYKERQEINAEREAGVRCGRTLQIGNDASGRSYWNFNFDPDCLFVGSLSK